MQRRQCDSAKMPKATDGSNHFGHQKIGSNRFHFATMIIAGSTKKRRGFPRRIRDICRAPSQFLVEMLFLFF
jgi:hypothetical protein